VESERYTVGGRVIPDGVSSKTLGSERALQAIVWAMSTG